MAYSNKPQALDSLLKEFLRGLPKRKELRRGMVLHFWPEVVGEKVAGITEDLFFERDRLIVKVPGEAWRHELHMSRFIIKTKLNTKAGSEIVKEIIIRC